MRAGCAALLVWSRSLAECVAEGIVRVGEGARRAACSAACASTLRAILVHCAFAHTLILLVCSRRTSLRRWTEAAADGGPRPA